MTPISIMIASPQYGGQCFGAYAFSCIQLQKLCSENSIPVEFAFLFNESLIQRGRNELADKFMKSEHTHLVFIDADLQFNPYDVLKLIAAEKSIIGGTYPRKRINWNNVKHAIKVNPAITAGELEYFAADYIFKVAPGVAAFEMDKPVEVEHVPTGFLCITREVFEKMMENPEIVHTEHNTLSGQSEIRHAFFECGINEDKEYLSEDFWFCRTARQLGFKVYLQPDINLTHIGTMPFKGCLPLMAAYMTKEQNVTQDSGNAANRRGAKNKAARDAVAK
jgi:hypothetical protein